MVSDFVVSFVPFSSCDELFFPQERHVNETNNRMNKSVFVFMDVVVWRRIVG